MTSNTTTDALTRAKEALDESNSLLVAMLHEKRPAAEIEEQIVANREAYNALVALPAQEPVACEYGHNNGDGTYSPTYARWPLPSHITPHKDRPVKLFYAAPPSADAIRALAGKKEGEAG